MFFKEGHHGKLLHKKHNHHQHQGQSDTKPDRAGHSNSSGTSGGQAAAGSAGDCGVVVKVDGDRGDVTKEMEKLRTLMAEVNKTLMYIKAVVNTGKMEMIPGLATFILENVMQIFTELRYLQRLQESNSLGSSQSKVCQNLAKFIAWTDNSVVSKCSSAGDSSKRNSSSSTTSSGSSSVPPPANTKQQQLLDQEQAKVVSDALSEGLEELISLGLEKMSQKRSSSFQPPVSTQLTVDISRHTRHSGSMPDIPLSPREQEILAQTSRNSLNNNFDSLGRSSNASTLSAASTLTTGRASNSSSVFSFDSSTDTVDGLLMPPPAKPPLPPGHQIQLNRSPPAEDQVDGLGLPLSVDCLSDVDPLKPPPLPQKKRSPSASVDFLGSLSSRNKPPLLNNSMSLDHSLGLASGQTHVQMRSKLGGPPTATVNGNGTVTTSSVSSSSTSSSSSSFSSTQHQSHVTVQQSSKTVTTQQTFSRTVSDSKLSSSSSASKKGKTFDEINQLTDQIKELTSTIQEIPPPLPAKKSSMQRLHSQYDNMPETIENRLAALSSTSSSSSTFSSHQRTTVVMRKEGRVSSSSTSSSQSSFSNQSYSQQQRMLHQHQAFDLALGQPGMAAQETYSSSETFSSNSHSSTESLPKPPPLPPKKKHVQDYMQTFGPLTQPADHTEDAISRHSITFYESLWHQHQRDLFYPRSNTISVFSSISQDSAASSASGQGGMLALLGGGPGGVGGSLEGLSANLPVLPSKVKRMSDASHASQVSTGSSQSDLSLGDILNTGRSAASDRSESPSFQHHQGQPNPTSAASETLADRPSCSPSPQPEESDRESDQHAVAPAGDPSSTISSNGSTATPVSSEIPSVVKPEIQKDSDSDFCELSLLDDIEIEDQLVFKKEGEEGPEVRGGAVDALIVHATQAGKIEFMYQEAFLTTYRMFISPKTLLEKLLYRFSKFQLFHSTGDSRKKLAHNAFSLLIRVVDELGCNELDATITDRLMQLVSELICDGTLQLARPLRQKLLEKCRKKAGAAEAAGSTGASMSTIASTSSGSIPASVGPAGDSQDTLLSFKSLAIAEQMTLLDSQLFQKIEIPEVLLWPSEQSEELSPHLTMFTEHFNKMSYWCRTRILTQDDPKDREKYHFKFIKIMRHLKELHNFNSYLAILSAVDSAPVRRLEWPEKNLEILHKLSQLIDSRSSFKAYRQALAETDPPCIPYLGLILQDLTFVDYGNPDKLPDGNINFAKHWQQFNILDSMRRFRTSNYCMARNERILAMFNNFEEYMQEEPLWQLSQKIKPRGSGGAASGAGTTLSAGGGHKKQNSVS